MYRLPTIAAVLALAACSSAAPAAPAIASASDLARVTARASVTRTSLTTRPERPGGVRV